MTPSVAGPMSRAASRRARRHRRRAAVDELLGVATGDPDADASIDEAFREAAADVATRTGDRGSRPSPQATWRFRRRLLPGHGLVDRHAVDLGQTSCAAAVSSSARHRVPSIASSSPCRRTCWGSSCLHLTSGGAAPDTRPKGGAGLSGRPQRCARNVERSRRCPRTSRGRPCWPSGWILRMCAMSSGPPSARWPRRSNTSAGR